MMDPIFPSYDEARDLPIVIDQRPVSFAGNSAVVLIAVAIISMASIALVAIYDLLVAACAKGCPL